MKYPVVAGLAPSGRPCLFDCGSRGMILRMGGWNSHPGFHQGPCLLRRNISCRVANANGADVFLIVLKFAGARPISLYRRVYQRNVVEKISRINNYW